MSDYEDILESYWECKFQVDQVFSKELEEPIVIHSRVPNESSLTIHSITSLRSLPPGVRLRVNNSEYMRTSCSPGWVSWSGTFFGHNEVYQLVLSTASRGNCLSISR